MKLFNDIYVLRIVIVFNLVSLLAAFCMGCSASAIMPGSNSPEFSAAGAPLK